MWIKLFIKHFSLKSIFDLILRLQRSKKGHLMRKFHNDPIRKMFVSYERLSQDGLNLY